MNAITPDKAFRYLLDRLNKISPKQPRFGGLKFRADPNQLWIFSLKDDAKTPEIALLYAWKTITEALLTVCTFGEIADQRFRITNGLVLLHGGLSSGGGQPHVCARSGAVFVEAEYSATDSASLVLDDGAANLGTNQDEARFHKALFVALRCCLALYSHRIDIVESHILNATKY